VSAVKLNPIVVPGKSSAMDVPENSIVGSYQCRRRLVGRKETTNAEWLLLFKCLDCGLEVSFCFPGKDPLSAEK
jgi:hypothetical protein